MPSCVPALSARGYAFSLSSHHVNLTWGCTGVVAALAALGDDDEELVWACKTKQMCAQKKERRVYLALTYLAVYTFQSDTGSGYLACRQRLRTADILAMHIMKGGLQIGLVSAAAQEHILIRFSKKSAQGQDDAQVFASEVARQFSDEVNESLHVVTDASADLWALCSVTAAQEKEHIAYIAARIARHASSRQQEGRRRQEKEGAVRHPRPDAVHEDEAGGVGFVDREHVTYSACSDGAAQSHDASAMRAPKHESEQSGRAMQGEKGRESLRGSGAWDQGSGERHRSVSTAAAARASSTARKMASLAGSLSWIQDMQQGVGEGGLCALSPDVFAADDFDPSIITGRTCLTHPSCLS